MVVEVGLLQHEHLAALFLLGVLIDDLFEPDLVQRAFGVAHEEHELVLLAVPELEARNVDWVVEPLVGELGNDLVADIPGVLEKLPVLLLPESVGVYFQMRMVLSLEDENRVSLNLE